MAEVRMLHRRDLLKFAPSVAAASGSLLLKACDGEGHFDFLQVENFGADVARPEIGQTVSLTWAYNFDKPEVQQRNPTNRLKSQRLIIKRLFLIGIAEQAIGPNAVGNTPALDVNARSFSLTFNGPIVVQLQGSFDATNAADNSDFRPASSAMLTLRLKQELFCRATFNAADADSAIFPYLGYPQDRFGKFQNPSNVDFLQFVVFHDAGTLGQVDLAARAPNLFPPDHTFRALSFSARQDQSFQTVSGSAYPPQVFSAPQLGQTNSMLFAGAIVFNGTTVQPAKGQDPNNDTRQAVLAAVQESQPIFLAIPMLFGQSTSSFTVADIHAGNAGDASRPTAQQTPLVLTALSTPTPTSVGSLGTIESTILVPSGSGFLHQGSIKGATLVHGVQKLNGDLIASVVTISAASWSCQFLPDDQLDQVGLSIGN